MSQLRRVQTGCKTLSKFNHLETPSQRKRNWVQVQGILIGRAWSRERRCAHFIAKILQRCPLPFCSLIKWSFGMGASNVLLFHCMTKPPKNLLPLLWWDFPQKEKCTTGWHCLSHFRALWHTSEHTCSLHVWITFVKVLYELHLSRLNLLILSTQVNAKFITPTYNVDMIERETRDICCTCYFCCKSTQSLVLLDAYTQHLLFLKLQKLKAIHFNW